MTRAQLLSLIMFDIGLPIIDAITKVVPLEDQERANASVAALLDKTIFNSDEIQDTLDISEDDMANVYVRISMASIAARIIALQYERTGKSPTAKDIKRYVSSLDTLQTFSDRYILGESLSKLYALESPEATRALRNMTKLSYLESFAPMIDVVVNFSFGVATQKMIQDVSEKLRGFAEQARVDILGTGYTNNQIRASELAILKVMVDLYCTCHTRQTKLIMEMDEEARGEESMSKHIEDIWASFENRLTMLTVLSGSIMPDEPDEELPELMKRIETGLPIGDDMSGSLGIKDDGVGFGDLEKDDKDDKQDDSDKGDKDKDDKDGGGGKKMPMIFSMSEDDDNDQADAERKEKEEDKAVDDQAEKDEDGDKEEDVEFPRAVRPSAAASPIAQILNPDAPVASRAANVEEKKPETQEAAKNQDDNKDDDDKGDSGSDDSAPKKGVSPMSFYVEKSESA